MARAQPKLDTPMTADEFIRFHNSRPDHERWELYDGVPVLNASAIDYHQIIVGNLTHYLDTVADERQPDWVAMPGFGVLVPGPRGDSVPTPDVIVRSATGLGKHYCSDPIVLFEVLSPDSGKRDLEIKRELYLRLPTVRHYVVIALKSVDVTAFDRDEPEPPAFAISPSRSTFPLSASPSPSPPSTAARRGRSARADASLALRPLPHT